MKKIVALVKYTYALDRRQEPPPGARRLKKSVFLRRPRARPGPLYFVFNGTAIWWMIKGSGFFARGAAPRRCSSKSARSTAWPGWSG